MMSVSLLLKISIFFNVNMDGVFGIDNFMVIKGITIANRLCSQGRKLVYNGTIVNSLGQMSTRLMYDT